MSLAKKKSARKFYLGQIVEKIGEYEFGGEFIFAATEKKLNSVVKKIEREYRPDSDVCQEEMTWQEIPKDDYDVLRKYLSVL